ncbi:SEC-C domain-containing protein [Elizabethkingia anophelis]|nr:SEC-C domain-containing protein [Elizabethkingia anophelis]MCT4194897.1 SEC-C domain-containing protein [Elizabethkingia anophelis]
MKPNVYLPCPCGSGKKIKFCCGIKGIKKSFDFKNYIENHNSVELLKIFALIQLIPENSSKIIRLEKIQNLIVQNLNTNTTEIDINILEEIITQNYPSSFEEDPNECCFSENLMFFNGNNIVFPGIANGVTDINQNILNTIFFFENNISEKCKRAIFEGTMFLLDIHNTIANKLEIKRFQFIDNFKEKIKFPTKEFLESNKNCFRFSDEDISAISKKYKINKSIITEFITNYETCSEYDFDNLELTRKPFIHFDEKYYLVLPSSEMYCLNTFINRKLKEFDEIDNFKNAYLRFFKNESGKLFSGMGWNLTSKYKKFDVFQFDTNKFAIVTYITSTTKSLEDYINEFIEKQNSEDSFIYVTITGDFDAEYPKFTKQRIIENAKFQIAISLSDLHHFLTLYSPNKLSLWKYLVAEYKCFESNVQILPYFSFLTRYYWYAENEGSFFPSDQPIPSFIQFDFELQGSQVINALQKDDRHLIPFIGEDGGVGYIPTYKTETYAPIYTSENIFHGDLEIILEKYNFPIWITNTKRYDFTGKNFADAVAYWLNDLYPSLKSFFPPNIRFPLNIELGFEEEFYKATSLDIENNRNSKVNFQYTIDRLLNKITIIIPVTLFNSLNRNDNYGERILMDLILNTISLLFKDYDVNITAENIKEILSLHMPLSMRKMIVTGDTKDDLKQDNRFIPSTRCIEKSDKSTILENIIKWSDLKIAQNVTSKNEKLDICYKVINALIDKVSNILKFYDTIELLEFTMLRHEALLNENSFKKVRLVTYFECFKSYEDAFNKFTKVDSENIRTALATRSLIEFIAAEPNKGIKRPNDNDVDFLVGLLDEIIFWGNLADSIKFDLDNPAMGLLSSGRIGVNYDFYERINDFTNEHKRDEHYESSISFNDDYEYEDFEVPLPENYYDIVDEDFKSELGITMPVINAIFFFLSHDCLDNEKSVNTIEENQFKEILINGCKLSDTEFNALIEHFVITPRGNILHPPESYEYSDIQPWRYNRPLSYLLKPIIKIGDKFIFSARHLSAASENYLAKFMEGAIKFDKKYKKLNKLQANRNNIKGKEFRNKVYLWLSKNPLLDVIPYEFKITQKIADKEYGDVDVLAFDKNKKIIYSIECKNTKQAKIIYEYYMNSKNYIDDKLPLHNNRKIWLENNLEKFSEIFKYDFSNFKVKSILISSYQLPLNLVKNIDSIDIYSLSEIKRKNIF